MTLNQRLLIGTTILLIGTFFRLWLFGEVPPGLQHDEIFKAEEGVRLIQQGDFRLFYPTNQGHEGAFVWLLGLAYTLVGINPLMIKLPAFICGMLTIALIFRFSYRTYAPTVGVLASGLTAVSFWGVFTSRVGLRAVMLPMIVLCFLLGISYLLRARKHQRTWHITILTGCALGFAIYTYTSSIALHVSFAVCAPILWLITPRRYKFKIGRDLLIVGIIGAVLTMPMIYIRLTDPQGSNRAESIATPLQEAQEGKPQQLVDNAFKLAGMPAFVGDPTWRYNVPGRPLFLLPIGLLAYIGLALAVLRIKHDPINLVLISILITGLIPSLVTVLAPSFLRSIVTLPSIMILIGIAVWQLSRLLPQRWLTWLMVGIIITVTGIVDYHAYFVTWINETTINLPYHDNREQGETVYEIYRDDLQQLANYIRNIDESIVFVSTPNQELDPLVYKFSGGYHNSDTDIVFFNAFANIILSEDPALLFVSPLSPISEKHQKWLTPEFGTSHVDTIYRQDGKIAFQVYRVSDTSNTLTQTLDTINKRDIYILVDNQRETLDFPINFGNTLLFHGLELPRETVYGENDGVNNQLYLEPLIEPSDASLNIFLHLIPKDGQQPVAQRDLLGISPAYWYPNIVFIQDNFVPFWNPVDPGNYQLVMGVYDIQTGLRLPVLDNNGNFLSDHIILGEIEVIPRPEE